jgi:hypothetical protein
MKGVQSPFCKPPTPEMRPDISGRPAQATSGTKCATRNGHPNGKPWDASILQHFTYTLATSTAGPKREALGC